MYFHSDSCGKDRKYHLYKTESAAKEGIKLIHIWEAEWKFKRNIVKSNLLHLLGKTPRIVYARKTEVRKVEKKVAKQFLDENHLQGSSLDKVRLGLYLGEELVSIMTFSSLRKAVSMKKKEGSYELVRFCSKLNTRVVGGASKLFKHFISNFNPEYILSYANRDWSTGGVYEALKMTFVGYTAPGYWYSKNGRRFSRVNYQKHKLVKQGEDPTLTESEIMKQNGFSRVWDCGNLKYEYTVR